MIHSRVFLTLCCFCISSLTFAQYSETIVTGRPGQANGPFAVGKNVYQVQSGIDFTQSIFKYDRNIRFIPGSTGSNLVEFNSINQNSVFRLGIAEHFELRVGYGYNIKDQYVNGKFKSELSGLNAFNLGVRKNFLKQKGIIPAVGLQLTARLGGLGDYELEGDDYIYQMRLLLQHKFSEKLSLNTNLMVETPSNRIDTDFLGKYIFSFGYSLTERFGITAECYGNYDNQNTDVLFDLGVSYLITNNFAVDVYGGYSENKTGGELPEVREKFISLGFSYRIDAHNQ